MVGRSGIIRGPIWGSFPVRGSFAGLYISLLQDKTKDRPARNITVCRGRSQLVHYWSRRSGKKRSRETDHSIFQRTPSGKTVGMICASGIGRIACQVDDRDLASSVHSFHGLSTAELPWRQLIDRSAGNSLIRDRVRAIDVIVWDEARQKNV